MKKLVVLSGGMDSTVLLYQVVLVSLAENVATITFNYGSKHNDEEWKRAVKTCEYLGVKNERITLPLDQYFKSDLLQSGGEIPEGHYAESNMKRTVVPFRNGIMLSIAAGYAESIGADSLYIGNHYGDHAIYPDCRESFIKPMTLAIREGTYGKVKLLSPFCYNTKADLATLGHELEVNWTDTYSCYKGESTHCGRCSTCFERREAFYISNVNDPTEYVDKTPIEVLIAEYSERLK